MRKIITLILVILLSIFRVYSHHFRCTEEVCKRPHCVCSDWSPEFSLKFTPQIVLISVNGALRANDFEKYYKPAYFGRKYHDCQIGVTFFVSHENTDYSLVHELWAESFEIGSYGISSDTIEYWKSANASLLVDEFEGQQKILSKFAKIPFDEIRGIRGPSLQMAGDQTFYALRKSNKLHYDNTWLTAQGEFWPYTLDFKSGQECIIKPCPVEPHKGVWVAPLKEWRDVDGVPCATIGDCQNIPKHEHAIFEWMQGVFNATYKTTRAPFTIAVNPGDFERHPRLFPAYLRFLDYLHSLQDVFPVTTQQAIEWAIFPIPWLHPSLFKCRLEHNHKKHLRRFCTLDGNTESPKYMTIYDQHCPRNYPTLDNPLGK